MNSIQLLELIAHIIFLSCKCMSRNCTLHPTIPLTNYCDVCKDVVCQQCIQLGPHADIRHKIITIEEAVNIKRDFYLAYRQNQIYPLRERASLSILQLEQVQEDYANDRKVIEKDVNLEFEGIGTRITAKINQEIIKRQTQIKANQDIINKIDDLAYSFEGLVQFPQRFLICYKQFDAQLKQLQSLGILSVKEKEDKIKEQFYETTFSKNLSSTVAKPSKSELVLPRQFPLTLAKASQLPQYKAKNSFLNSLVVKSLQNYKEEVDKAKKDVVENQKRILSIYNRQNAELLKLQSATICAYCLVSFNFADVNETCSHNKSYKSEPNYKEITVPQEIRGTKMHFWVPAKKSERPIPDIKAHSLIRGLQKKQFLCSLKDIRQVRCKLREYDIEKGQQKAYLEQFKKDDAKGEGKVTPLAFLFIMTNKFEIDQVQVEVLSQLCHSKEDALVNYTKIEEILEDPEKLYHKFLSEEEELEKAKPVAPASTRFRY